jgi:hypothetical protein
LSCGVVGARERDQRRPHFATQVRCAGYPNPGPGIAGAGFFGFLLSFNELLRSVFLRGSETTMPIYNRTMAASQQSQVPIIFALSRHDAGGDPGDALG